MKKARLKALLVDNSQRILQLMSEFMKRAGFETMTAVNATEALRAIRANSDINIVIAELEMEGITGWDLHLMLIAMNNPLARQMVFVTGNLYSPRYHVDDVRACGFPLLEKPFDANTLTDTCADIIAMTH